MTGDVIAGFLRVLDRVRSCKCGRPSQLPDTPPAVSPLPLRYQLQDLIDRLVLFAGSEFDPGDQQLIDSRQQARVDYSLTTSALNNPGHTKLSQLVVGNSGKMELSKMNWQLFLTIISSSAGGPILSPE